jgi:eukaryotic-like serine/threonine-protein kinase
MKTASPGVLAVAGAEAEALIKEARRRQRRRYLLTGVVVVLVLAGVVGVLVSQPSHRPSPRSSAAAASTSPGHRSFSVPLWARSLGGEVAYQCGNEICLMRPDGTGGQLVSVSGPWPQWDPAWSPDGRLLSFRGYYGSGDGQYDLYTVDANGCHLIRLTRQVNGTSPSWSPTGRQIAFAVGGINVINADGTGLRTLTKDTHARGDESPAWSSRNRIAFVRFWFLSHRPDEIYTVNPDGSGAVGLTHGGPGFGQPSWSRNGRQIAFVAFTGHSANTGAPMTIEIANADGSGIHPASPRSWASYSPTWTPDGKIVFLRQTGAPTTSTAGSSSAYVVNPDGTGLRLLYAHLDATQIAWGSGRLPRAGC